MECVHMQMCVHLDSHLWSLDEHMKKWNTRIVCRLSVLSGKLGYMSREAYVHVIGLIFVYARAVNTPLQKMTVFCLSRRTNIFY